AAAAPLRPPRGLRRAAAVPRDAASPARRPERELLGVGALRSGAGRGLAAPARAVQRTPGRGGCEPRRALASPRALDSPGDLRRPLPPVRELLPPPARFAGVGHPALRPDHALRLARLRRTRRRRSNPPHLHVRNRRGEPRQQPRGRDRPPASGLAGVARRAPGRPQLDLVARFAPPPPGRALPASDGVRRDDRDGILAYGSYGRPLLVFPAERGNRYEWERTGMIAAIADLIEDGRLK